MKRPSRAFTLVELLVVITIIGVLVGIAVPAVQSARESARRAQCLNSMRQLALGGVQHENQKGRFPGYVEKFGLYTAASDPSSPGNTPNEHVKLGTWAVAILPYLEGQPTYEHWTEDRYPILHDTEGTTGTYTGIGFHPLAAPNLAIFQCPSNPVSEGSNAKNSYIYNSGFCHVRPGGAAISGVDFENSQDRDNGVGNSKYNVSSIDTSGNGEHEFEGPDVRLDDLKDGAGSTILFSENVQALPWFRPGLIDGSALEVGMTGTILNKDVIFNANASAAAESARYIHGLVWHYEDDQFSDPSMSTIWNELGTGSNVAPIAVAQFHKINGGGATATEDIFTKVIGGIVDARDLARPSSFHVGGVNAGMADGATRFITENIDYRVYQALITTRGKRSSVPWEEFILTDELN